MNRLLVWSSLALCVFVELAGSAASNDRPSNDPSNDRPPHNNSRGNAFVNDPCLDPPPPDRMRTVQSETEIAVLNSVHEDDDDDDADDGDGDDSDGSPGKLMVAGYNDSHGQYDTRQGLSGFSYSTNRGRQWIDGGGLPPLGETDRYLGHPGVAVHHRTKTFYYASLYQNSGGAFTVSVNRGMFKVAPQQVPLESFANTRCERNPALHGIPDPPAFVRNRIIWEPPVEAVAAGDDGVDGAWLYVNQETGFLYLTYTRFGAADGATPVELVRSFDGGRTWTPPSVVIPNLLDTFNQAARPVVTPAGRVIVTWFAQTFDLFTGQQVEHRIEAALSDDCDMPTPATCTFSPPIIVDRVNPQGTPLGDNRFDFTILNVPSIMVDKGRDEGVITRQERRRPGFGNVYITYFDGQTPFTQTVCETPDDPCEPIAMAANILLSRSLDDGTTYKEPVKVNDDPGDTSHVFPSVQVNKFGEVFVTWIDRRVDRPRNLLNDTWGDISTTLGASFDGDGRISTVSTDWITRWDDFPFFAPNFGNYNSSEVVGFKHFLSIWADGRFPRPSPITATEPPFNRPEEEMATPDSLSAIIKRNGSVKR